MSTGESEAQNPAERQALEDSVASDLSGTSDQEEQQASDDARRLEQKHGLGSEES